MVSCSYVVLFPGFCHIPKNVVCGVDRFLLLTLLNLYLKFGYLSDYDLTVLDDQMKPLRQPIT